MLGLDDIGPALPPDEPQCSSNLNPSAQRRSQERIIIGPTLPCSSDEDEEIGVECVDREFKADDGEQQMNCNEKKKGINQEEGNEEEPETMVIGPMPPPSEISEAEEHAEYLARLAQFEANKEAKVFISISQWFEN